MEIRNSEMEIGEVYFWTSTIVGWKKLLKKDEYKDLIIESLRYFPPMAGVLTSHLDRISLIIKYGITEFRNGNWRSLFLDFHNCRLEKLLKKDEYKDLIIESLRYLCEKDLIKVYGFVIMWSATRPIMYILFGKW